MYITEQDLLQVRLQLMASASDSQILFDLIDDDETAKSEMQDGIDYYNGDHDILDHEIKYTVDGVEYVDENATNNRVVHPFLTYITDQQADYVCGQPIAVGSEVENDPIVERFKDIRGERFDETMLEYVRGAKYKGFEVLHPFVNEDGEFDYVIIPAEQMILVYDSTFQRKLVQAIRYYEYEYIRDNGTTFNGYKVEWWTDKDVSYFVQREEGEFILDPEMEQNPAPHLTESMEVAGQVVDGTMAGLSWGKVPFIVLKNNSKFRSDLKILKPMIDDYDTNVSDFSNNLSDIQEAYWVLKGYMSQDLGEFRTNLKKYRAIKVDEKGGVEPQKIDIPHDPRDSHLNRLEENIYIFARGINPKTDVFGNSPSGVALRWLFMPMDLKCNGVMRSLTMCLKELVWYFAEYLKMNGEGELDPSNVKFTFNKSMIINEAEQITNVVQSKGLIDEETNLSHHPWVDDPKAVMEKLETERQEAIDRMIPLEPETDEPGNPIKKKTEEKADEPE
jgi:SPP1 family phage portal protein